MKLSQFGIFWRSITLFIILSLCTSLLINLLQETVTRYSLGNYGSFFFMLIALIGSLLMIIGILLLYKNLYRHVISNKKK
jgi:hypothetical protein